MARASMPQTPKIVSEATQQAQSWLEVIKEKIQSFFNSLNLNQKNLVEYLSYFGIGILAGVIFKKFARAFILYALIFGGLLYGLHYFDVITFDWTKLKDLIGMAPGDSGFSTEPYMAWAREHIMQLIIGIIGFAVGYSIG